MTRFETELIRRYYERHTRAFVAFGQGGPLGAMHRAVAGPGVSTRAEAFRYVEDMIIAVVERHSAGSSPRHVIDLGCGVGGSLCYIAERLPITGTGITLSPTQAALARERIAGAGLSDRVTVLVGDYTDVPRDVVPADLVFGIESFVHAPDATRFFAQCRRLVRPGGAFVICDDFRRAAAGPEATAAIERFRRGWHINTLLEPEDLLALAAAAGFDHESTTDLSPYVEISRLRDRLVDVLARPIERLPWRWSRLDPWLGGSALQTCLRNGWLGYDLVVFRPASDR
ncbi:MAG TPA: methyltransferase domain-containing protein [Vicinamibacterales bacterium]|nr:methyltransferase domain-containing protein [Vicinamibacterales bacterium]